MIYILFKLLFLVTPLLFLPFTSDLFELPKMYFVYFITCIILIVWGVKSVRHKTFIFKRTILDIPFALFILATTLATIFSIDPFTSFFGLYGRPSGGLLSVVSFSLLYWAFVANIDQKHIFSFIKIILISGSIVAVWAIIERLGVSLGCVILTGNPDTFCWAQDVRQQSFATLGQPNSLGTYMTSIFPIATTIHPFLSVLFYIALIFTNSKSAFLGAVAVMIIMAYFFRKQKKVLLKFFIPTIVATLLLGTQWIQNISPANTTLWQAAIKIVTARPLIGTGPDTFGQSYFWVRPKAHNQIPDWDLIYNKPNNQYLQVATGSGILGLTTYIAIIASVIYVFKKIKKDKLSILIFSGWIGVIVANFFSSVSSTSQLTFYLFPAMLIAQGLPQKEGKHLKKRFVTLIFGLIALAVFFLVILGASLMADVYYTHGRKLNSQSKPNEAISYLQKAINLSPHNSLFWEETALAHEQIISDNNMKAANEYSKSAVLLSPYNTNLLKSRAGILTKIAKAEPSYNKELEEVLMRLMLLAPTDPSVYLMSGIYYANINNPTLAYELLNKALNLKSDYTRARIALASLLVNYGKNDDAKKELNIILEYDSNNQYVQELLKTIK